MNQIEEIKDRIDIVDIVSETVQLRRSGKSFVGFCPFHKNTRTPAFVVFPETGTWRCFGECNEGGDVFSYVMKKEGWDFPQTLENLAKRAGIDLKPITPQQQEQIDENEKLRQLLSDAIAYYQQNLTTPAGKLANDYISSRHITEETKAAFQLGYALDDYEAAQKYLLNKGYTIDQIVEAGIAYRRDDGRTTDRFRHRVMIPIHDTKGRPVGFGARALRKDEPAKYLNSPQSALFDKSNLLFGYHKAQKTMRELDQAVIVEGYMGVILLHQNGYTNTVAQMGTALTEQQLRHLKRTSLNLILALDSDAAGLKATMRGLEVARNTLEHSEELKFDAFGLISKEARLKAEIRVASLPLGQDPDDVVNQDPSQWKTILEKAKPIVEHVMQTLIQNTDLSNPKNKSKIAEQVIPLIKDIPDRIERDHYTQRLASLLSIDVNTLYDLTRQGSNSNKPTYRNNTPAEVVLTQTEQTPTLRISNKESAILKLESYCLSCILRDPELIYPLNRLLKANGLEDISNKDFVEIPHRTLFDTCQNSLSQEHSSPAAFVIELTQDDLIDLADQILQITDQADLSFNTFQEEFFRSFLTLRQRKLQQINQELQNLLADPSFSTDQESASKIHLNLLTNANIRLKLDKALNTIHDHLIKPNRN